jgi:hypothetical protein
MESDVSEGFVDNDSVGHDIAVRGDGHCGGAELRRVFTPGASPIGTDSWSIAALVKPGAGGREECRCVRRPAYLTAVQTIPWKEKMGAGATAYAVITPQGKLKQIEHEAMLSPLSFEFKRPTESRLELGFNGDTAVQVICGANGWKLRPFPGRSGWGARTPDEQQAAADPGIGGLLINYVFRCAKADSAGTEESRATPFTNSRSPARMARCARVWVDRQSLLILALLLTIGTQWAGRVCTSGAQPYRSLDRQEGRRLEAWWGRRRA